ncbi:hypothetical protein CYLTODRAFT_387027 [Cylindrobasidium torrendii FP15055 ss-10]|uniref:ATP synthase F(0) complex subunit e, mitochondrial n=1 Tax=Cylindrobasidium torrendii FP15055 ss-10 TaxID=1314674 RepID=A0A0D7BTA2_9AGAR|nr:hypothetical protein CYLTODRAFT_387027 [Cylindrobasidium torrendii FP15055 ss-10]
MVSAPTLNVIRYSALLSGVAYGWYHRRSLRAAHAAHKTEHQEKHREHLIAEAKEAWKKKQESSKVDDGLVTDPEDPRFDLEKLVAHWEKAT